MAWSGCAKPGRIHVAERSFMYRGIHDRLFCRTIARRFGWISGTENLARTPKTKSTSFKRMQQSSTSAASLMATDPGDLVLDPTCGSGTTATVAEQWGRRWITIDTSRVALSPLRVRAVMSSQYSLTICSPTAEKGRSKEAQLTGRIAPGGRRRNDDHDLRQGFVYDRAARMSP